MYKPFDQLTPQQAHIVRRNYENPGQPGPVEAYEYAFGDNGQLLGRVLKADAIEVEVIEIEVVAKPVPPAARPVAKKPTAKPTKKARRK